MIWSRMDFHTPGGCSKGTFELVMMPGVTGLAILFLASGVTARPGALRSPGPIFTWQGIIEYSIG
jgi:hypothetical protein